MCFINKLDSTPPFLSNIPAYPRRTLQLSAEKVLAETGKVKGCSCEHWGSPEGSPMRWELFFFLALDPAVPGTAVDQPHLQVPAPPQRLERGVELSNLHLLSRASSSVIDEVMICWALITFILNDFFLLYKSSILCFWWRCGFEVVSSPQSQNFFLPIVDSSSSLELQVTVESALLILLPADSFSSFEVQLLGIKCESLVLCVVIYQQPKFKDNFLHSQQLFLIMIGLWLLEMLTFMCAVRPTKDFLSLISSFNLNPLVGDPTHEKGHILDLFPWRCSTST